MSGPKETPKSNTNVSNNKAQSINLASDRVPKPLIGLNKKILDAIKNVTESIKNDDLDNARNILVENHPFQDTIVNSKEVLDACKNNLMGCYDINEFLSFMDEQGIEKETINSILICACKDSLVECLKNNWLDNADDILLFMKERGIIEEEIKTIINSKEVLEACNDVLVISLIEGQIDNTNEILTFMDEQGIEKRIVNNILINANKSAVACCLEKGWITNVDKILSLMDNKEIKMILNSNESLNASKDWLVSCLRSGHVDSVDKFISFMDKRSIDVEEFKSILKINSEEILNACKNGFVECLRNNQLDKVNKILSFLNGQNVSKKEIRTITNSNEVFNACKDGVVECLRNCKIDDVDEILSFMNEQGINKQKIKTIFNSNALNACKDGIVECLRSGKIDLTNRILSIMKKQCVKEEEVKAIMNSNEVLNAYQGLVVKGLISNMLEIVSEIISNMNKQGIEEEKIKTITNSDEVINICKTRLINNLKESCNINRILSFIDEQGLSKKIINSNEVISACKSSLVKDLKNGRIKHVDEILSFMVEYDVSKETIKSITSLKENLGCSSIKDLIKYDNIFLSYVIENNITDFSFLDKIKEYLNNNLIKKYGLYALLKKYEEINNLEFYNNKEKLYEVLKKHDKRWQDEANINNPFEEGARVFGYDKMFKYLNSENLNLHDALYNFHTICTLSKKDSLGPEHFFNNILAQVAKDGGNYNEGSAYNHFNSISNSLRNDDIGKIIEEAKSLVNTLDDIKELLNIFKSKEDVFSSWKNLKKFLTLKELLEKGKLLEELAELKKEDKVLYDYIKPLLFHKDSKVDRNAIFEFWKNPDKFFARIDSIAGPMHKSLRPSNYKEYGLSGKELQQAIVQGKLDNLQLIRPSEITYSVRNMTLSEALTKALGERGKGAKSKEPKKIFDKIKKLGLTIQDIKDIKEGKEKSNEIQEKIWEILEEDEQMKFLITKHIVKATIHKKSDPFGAIVGDDTACCMPFGSGKMNEYLTNLGTAIFSVRIQNGDGSWRTIAQSVLTTDIDIGKQVSGILENVKRGGLAEIPIDSLGKPLVLTCDNVEVARNYKEYISLIENTYKEFFRTYLGTYGKSINLDTSKVVIGQGYSDALRGLNKESNTYIPASVIGYSDNVHSKCYVLDIDDMVNSKFNILQQDISHVTLNSSMGKYKVRRMNVQDILPIARLEEEIYSQTGLNEGVVEIQNEIIANLILCEKQNKPCFMFIMSSKNNKPLGYIRGYEREVNSRRIVYISDFAMLEYKDNKSASSAILISFLKSYKEAYQDKEIFPPIVSEFRENTSYKFIKDEKRLNMLFKHFGLRVKVKENETEQRGNETFHNCTLFVKKL